MPPYRVCRSDGRGSHIHATELLLPGRELWREVAFASVVLDEVANLYCHECLKPIEQQQQQPGAVCPSSFRALNICSKCQWATYCSKECASAANPVHSLVCDYIGSVAHQIADTATVTVNRVRLLLICLAVRYRELQQQVEEEPPSPEALKTTEGPPPPVKSVQVGPNIEIIKPTYKDTCYMESNVKHFGADWLACFEGAAKLILRFVPPELQVLSVDALVALACISDTNSFGLTTERYEYFCCIHERASAAVASRKGNLLSSSSFLEGTKPPIDKLIKHLDEQAIRCRETLTKTSPKKAASPPPSSSSSSSSQWDPIVWRSAIKGICAKAGCRPLSGGSGGRGCHCLPTVLGPVPAVVSLSVAGLGIYPLSAKLNHSCFPSAEYRLRPTLLPDAGSNHVGRLAGAPLSMTLTRVVRSGEEITDCYTDMYTDRITRRNELLRAKQFICHCERCDMPLEKSIDRYLDGICCPNCVTLLKPTTLPAVDAPLEWNSILGAIGHFLVTNHRECPPYLWRAISAVLVDLCEFDFWWVNKQGWAMDTTHSYEVRELGSEEGCEADIARLWAASGGKPKFESLYDPTILSVLLPPKIVDDLGLEIDDNLLRVFLPQGGPPEHITDVTYRCEKCKKGFPKDVVEGSIEKSLNLQMRVIERFQCPFESATVGPLRREVGLYLRMCASEGRHPFNAWMYRISQKLVDSTRAVISASSWRRPLTTEEADFKTILLLVDVVLLRYQIACQSCVFPPFHEEKFLALRTLVAILQELNASVLPDRRSSFFRGKFPFSPKVVISGALSRCSKLAADLCQVVIAPTTTSS